jgi:hypothetical protein
MEREDLPLPEGVRSGEMFAGKYRIEKVIGGGAMGILVRAEHLFLERPVAIKFLQATLEARSGAIHRFVREARAAARMTSAHVVRILDAGLQDHGAPYIVMELLEGSDLARYLKDHGPLEASLAVELVVQAASALAEAHSMGVVHRDLKPANLFLVRADPVAPFLKVVDFGIAKSPKLVAQTLDISQSRANAGSTEANAILGSPLYMAPEQMESAYEVDARADIWALGVTLFELVAGRPPFDGATLIQLYSQFISRDPAWRSHWPRSAPAGLADVIARCLQRQRDDRYATMRDLAAALAPFRPAGARAVGDVDNASSLRGAFVEMRGPGTELAGEPLDRPAFARRPRRRAWAMPVVASIFLVGAMVAGQMRAAPRGGRDPAAAEAGVSESSSAVSFASIALTASRIDSPPPSDVDRPALPQEPAPAPPTAEREAPRAHSRPKTPGGPSPAAVAPAAAGASPIAPPPPPGSNAKESQGPAPPPAETPTAKEPPAPPDSERYDPRKFPPPTRF